MPKMSSGHGSVAAGIVDLWTSFRQIVWFVFCCLIGGDYLVFFAEEWMNSRAGLYVVAKKKCCCLLGIVCQIRQVRGLCSQTNLKFSDFHKYDFVVGVKCGLLYTFEGPLYVCLLLLFIFYCPLLIISDNKMGLQGVWIQVFACRPLLLSNRLV